MPILETANVRKTYAAGKASIEALKGITLALDAGEFTAVMGPSGCGKSSLLHLCGAMDLPSSGTILFEGQSLTQLDERRLTILRRQRIGFVFQFFNLLPTLTVLENVVLPLLLGGVSSSTAERKAVNCLERVGLSGRLSHFPQQLSGGEAQRTAVARAIVHKPALLIADEPTGNLDSTNGRSIIALLEELNRETRLTILLATHSTEVAAAAQRTMFMRDGTLSDPQL